MNVAVWIFTATYWLLLFVVPEIMYMIDPYFIVTVIVVPILCHIVMFTRVRRHHQDILDHLTDQGLSVTLQREKQVAHSMALITLTLLILVLPTVVVLSVPSPFALNVVFPWTTTLCLMVSSLNPVIHLCRSKSLREVTKAVFHWLPFTVSSHSENGLANAARTEDHGRDQNAPADDAQANDDNKPDQDNNKNNSHSSDRGNNSNNHDDVRSVEGIQDHGQDYKTYGDDIDATDDNLNDQYNNKSNNSHDSNRDRNNSNNRDGVRHVEGIENHGQDHNEPGDNGDNTNDDNTKDQDNNSEDNDCNDDSDRDNNSNYNNVERIEDQGQDHKTYGDDIDANGDNKNDQYNNKNNNNNDDDDDKGSGQENDNSHNGSRNLDGIEDHGQDHNAPGDDVNTNDNNENDQDNNNDGSGQGNSSK